MTSTLTQPREPHRIQVRNTTLFGSAAAYRTTTPGQLMATLNANAPPPTIDKCPDVSETGSRQQVLRGEGSPKHIYVDSCNALLLYFAKLFRSVCEVVNISRPY